MMAMILRKIGKVLEGTAVKNFYKEGRKKVMFGAANIVRAELQRNILKEIIKIPPKGADWARRSLDDRPLVNTQEYVDKFRAVKLKSGAALQGDWVLFNRLENGTRKMKPRPHLRPTMKRLRRRLVPLVAKEVMRELFGR